MRVMIGRLNPDTGTITLPCENCTASVRLHHTLTIPRYGVLCSDECAREYARRLRAEKKGKR